MVPKFLKRHPNVSERRSENINSKQSVLTLAGIRKWHSNLHDNLQSVNALNILDDPDGIINYYITGFQTNPSKGTILGKKGMKNLYM